MIERFFGRVSVLALGLTLTLNVVAQGSADASKGSKKTVISSPSEKSIVLPESVPDPIEPFNRMMWDFNQAAMKDVVKPSAKVYRFIVRKPLRAGIGNFGKNVTYPDRLINNLLQSKWTGARDETYRFLCNTILGVGGLFDVGTYWEIPKSNRDFGQTFAYWGWKPNVYLMIPFVGPSNERDGLGLLGDAAVNPLTYLDPPYSYASYGFNYNNLTDSVDDYVRLTESEMDPYSVLQYAWTFARENQVVNFQVKGEQDKPSLETLQSVFFTFRDPSFPDHGKTKSVLIPTTGKRLKFTTWLQQGKAPIVYIVPGLGSHRLAGSAIALAELVYQKGFSAVCVSSTFNSEFMENASTAIVPAYTPVDAKDLHVALTEIDRELERTHPNRLGAKALMGYSMGAFQSLFIAATESTNQPPLLQFDRYVAINTPVRLTFGVSRLDEFYNAALEWPAEERTENIKNTFLKVAALSRTSLTPSTTLPFSAIESKFLIGVAFRLILRDAIFSSQLRHNQGVLRYPIKKNRREQLYREIMDYSFSDYLQKFVVPYYQTRGIDLSSPNALVEAGDLKAYTSRLQANPKVRLIENQNDILLAEEDLKWLRTTFPPDEQTVFETGGHLGNLAHPSVQKAILGALEDLNPVQTKKGKEAEKKNAETPIKKSAIPTTL
ncbi:MAG: VacJ family lipoprotein [Verrucomicrobiales bacterium]|nr:VacJ family lipoprotein [Verrucomicrobiales bacterium]